MEFSSFWVALYMLISNLEQISFIFFRPLLYVFLYFSQFYFYSITKRENQCIIINKVKTSKSLFYDENNNPYGYLLLRDPKTNYICGIMNLSLCKYEHLDMKIITTPNHMKYLLSNECIEIMDSEIDVIREKNKNLSKNTFNLCVRHGEYQYIDYRVSEIELPYVKYNKHQEILFSKIIDAYKIKTNIACYVYGSRGKGKTYFAHLLARSMNATLCKTFNPCEPGNNFCILYSRIMPTKNKPLILLLDEVDIILEKIHHNKVNLHKNIPTEVYDKTTWNAFLDNFDFGIYKNVILLLTSNESKSKIDALDRSYLRKGRIDITYVFL